MLMPEVGSDPCVGNGSCEVPDLASLVRERQPPASAASQPRKDAPQRVRTLNRASAASPQPRAPNRERREPPYTSRVAGSP